jgi:hypothetical protein
MNREQLTELMGQLSMLSVPSLEGVYRKAHAECRYDGENVPSAASIQELVAAWKVLRKMYKTSAIVKS